MDRIDRFVLEQVPWEKLPIDVRQALGNSKQNWNQAVVERSIRFQLRWATSPLVKEIIKEEKQYYTKMMETMQKSLLLYPYHLSDVLVKGLGLTPFKYYLEMMLDVLLSDKSYDSVPNFTAADALRLLGFGRNQFIDAANAVRSKGWIWASRKRAMARKHFPEAPLRVPMEHWWEVHLTVIPQEELKTFPPDEVEAIEELKRASPRKVGELDPDTLYALYCKGAVYIDVPLSSSDYIKVPPLEGFVMNRVSGDPFEKLLYKIWVSVDERTSMQQLAHMLQTDLELVLRAVSVYLRLGFARKKNVEPITEGAPVRWHPKWIRLAKEQAERGAAAAASDSASEADMSGCKRIGFVFDSTLTAFLMMGNLNMGLKQHAVTLFEVGKLQEEVMDLFIAELHSVGQSEDALFEGEAQRYVEHAICLRNTLDFLRKPDRCGSPDAMGIDMLRWESLQSLDAVARSRLLQKNYAALVVMTPVSLETNIFACSAPPMFGPAIPEGISPWLRLFVYHTAGAGPPCMLFVKGTRVHALPALFRPYERVMLCTWNHDPSIVSVSVLLSVLNDTLRQSPVLVVAFASERGRVDTLDIPFPLAPSDADDTEAAPAPAPLPDASDDGPAGHTDDAAEATAAPAAATAAPPVVPGPDAVPPADAPAAAGPAAGLSDGATPMRPASEREVRRLLRTPAVQRVARALGLHAGAGFIRMARIGEAWVPLEAHLGLPLFDTAINQTVLERLAARQMFGAAGLRAHTRAAREFALELLDFVARMGGADVGHGVVAMPTRAAVFDGRHLSLM